jgi:hypothetical protein
MFKNCPIMILLAGPCEFEVCKLETDSKTQTSICDNFSLAIDEMIKYRSAISFDGNYKPINDEYLVIDNFILNDSIKDSIRKPIGVESFAKNNNSYPQIKAIFVGKREDDGKCEIFKIAFQRLRKDQFLFAKGINLFLKEDTFTQETAFGINLTDVVDCFYTEGKLQFRSFYFARQIFDLSEYYRSATDQEVLNFTKHEKLLIQDIQSFQEMANTWIRRKIAIINDTGVLDNYSSDVIQSLADKEGIKISVENNQIVIPNDRETLKVILGFLDEEAYRGPFSQETYLANSKRKISI